MPATISPSLSLSLPLSPAATYRSDPSAAAAPFVAFRHSGLHFCSLRREALALRSPSSAASGRILPDPARRLSKKTLAAAKNNGSPAKGFDYDLVIIGAGVGGHGTPLHAVEKIMPSVSVWVLAACPVASSLRDLMGVVTRTSEVLPELLQGTFKCLKCGGIIKNVE